MFLKSAIKLFSTKKKEIEKLRIYFKRGRNVYKEGFNHSLIKATPKKRFGLELSISAGVGPTDFHTLAYIYP